MSNDQATIDKAKADFLQSKGRLVHGLNTTPDDRINWSPSPTARTPIEQVAHAASSIKNIHGFLQGDPFTVPTTAEADKGFREHDAQFKSREQVLAALEDYSANYLAWLEQLSPDQLSKMVSLPFGMGEVPTAIALTFIPMHTDWHTAQLDYIQTIYGDHDWHAGR